MKRPMTTEEFFDRICGILREKGMMPDILDYALATHEPVPMATYEYSIGNSLDYGGSEGIYLDLWIERCEDSKRCISDIGVFKTLREDDGAMRIMAGLLADFIIEQRRFVNANLDDFRWTGADVYPVDGNGERPDYGWGCASMASALEKKDELLEKYPQVAVRDNATRKEKVYTREGE